MKAPPQKTEAKLNIFALPSQTTLLFGLIVTVLLGTVFVGSIGPSPICTWPLALGLLFLPLRTFLARPERDFARHNLSPAGDDLADLQQAIETNAKAIGLRRTPRLVVSPSKRPLYTFGTRRHWYIAVNHEAALRLQESLEDPDVAPVAQARLIHELYHFKTGDYWQMGYTRELLRTVFLFMAWAATFFCGFGFLLIVAAPDFLQLDPTKLLEQAGNLTPEVRQMLLQIMPSPGEMEAVRQKAAVINLPLVLNFIVGATLPYVIMGGILWGLYWPKLWRMREFYADAGVVQAQGKATPYLSALTQIPLPLLKKYPYERSLAICQQGKGFLDIVREWWRRIKALLKRHPDAATRITCVKDPSQVIDNWVDAAILAGSLTLLLDILLVSPLTILYAGSWPMHFSTLAILVVVSLNLISPLAQGKSVWSDMLKIIVVVVALRLAWLLLTIGLMILLLVFAPDILSETLVAFVASSAHFAGYSDELIFDNLSAFVVKASILNLAQVLIIFFILMVALVLVAFLLRCLLTWYRFPQVNQRLMKVAYLVIGWVALLLGLTILPLITTALLRLTDLLNLPGIIVGALGLIIAATGLGLFIYAHRKYARRCPRCGTAVPGWYHVGKRCKACNALLHPWLIAEYEL